MAADTSAKIILLIEDDAVLAKMYSQKLATLGYEVLIATDGGEGLDLSKKNKIDLVLTDIMLPRVSGTEFIGKFKKISQYSKTPIIAWSNLSDMSERDLALKLGAREYMVKGQVSLEQVVNTVKKYLEK